MGKPGQLKQWASDILLTALLAFVSVAVTLAYTGAEHNLHWWIDWYNRTIEVVDALQRSPLEAWTILDESLKGERNQLYTLPLIPFLLIFGQSRPVYQVALALVYLLPFSLVMGGIATYIIPGRTYLTFWLAAAITLLVPATWASTFLGIPDTGGAVLVGVAMLLYLKDQASRPTLVRYHQRRWRQLLTARLGFRDLVVLLLYWRLPLMGVFLAGAILLRRHFAYGVVALIGGICLQSCWYTLSGGRHWWRRFLAESLRLGVVVATCWLVLQTIAPEFTQGAVSNNYRHLYASWSLPVLTISRHYLAVFGLATWGLVLLGFGWGFYRQSLVPGAAGLLLLSGGVSLVIWLGVLRYGNIFYTLHIIPLVVVGLTLAVQQSGNQWLKRLILAGLAINLGVGFTDSRNLPGRSFLALGIPPLVRNDYTEVTDLIAYLRSIATKNQPIYVAGYQRLHLSPSLINSGEIFLYGQNQQILNILSTPQADSQDNYPIEQLLQAEFVVLPSNLGEYLGDFAEFPANGEWLPPGESDVVRVVLEAFTQKWEISEDFQLLPRQFYFQGNTIVRVYQRTKATTLDTAIRTLAAMQQAIPEIPGNQLPWLSLTDWFDSTAVFRDGPNSYTLVAFPANYNQAWTRNFVYLFPLSQPMKIRGFVNFYYEFCQELSFRVRLYSSTGEVLESGRSPTFLEPAEWELSIPSHPQAAYLSLETLPRWREEKQINSCGFWLSQVKVTQ